MFYEIKLKVVKDEKQVSEQYITDEDLFAHAEYKGLNLYQGNCDVCAIKRSAIKEISEEKHEGEEFYKAVIQDIFLDDAGKEKELKYQVLIPAKDIAEAHEKAKDYIRQGLSDMELVEIKRTKILGEL